MSQKDTTKNNKAKPNPNPNHQSNNIVNHSNTMKYENKRSAAAAADVIDGSTVTLYENFIPQQDNNNKYPNFALGRQPNKSAPFIDVQGFVHNATTAGGTLTFAADEEYFITANAKDKIVPDYENVNFKPHLELDKRVLLQKYFRTALVGPRSNIYENLCRGCNYGVFTARGSLCSFCECIVNGVPSISASPAESSNNIYENICGNCAQFYSGNEEDCQCRKKSQLVVTFRDLPEEVEEEEQVKEVKQKTESAEKISLKKIGSEDCLLTETIKEKKVKIRKSQSFNKSAKPKKLTNFWDTLRKPKTSNTPARKPLEIVHNVEGYDQVFHTKDTFDLQRICELKRSVTSCSDQHIYGRLKTRDLDLVTSHEDFLSTQSLTQNEQGVKKRRISKTKFLRSISVNNSTQIPPEVPAKPKVSHSALSISSPQPTLQAVYLNNSVCQWMTSLRYDFFNIALINTCILNLADEESDCLCYPKSVPAKRLLFSSTSLSSSLSSCKAATAPTFRPKVTNRENIAINVTKSETPSTDNTSLPLARLTHEEDFSLADTDSLDSTEIVALRRHLTKGDSSLLGDSWEVQCSDHDNIQQKRKEQIYGFLPRDRYQQMVEEFKFHLINKQVREHHHQQRLGNNENMVNNNNNKIMASAGVNNNNSSVSGNTVSKSNVDIPLRQAVSNHNKAKRQGIYLRLGESPPQNLQNATTEQGNNKNNHNDLLLVLPKREEDTQDDHNNNCNSTVTMSINEESPSETQLSTVKSFDSNRNSQESHNNEDKENEYISRALSKQQVATTPNEIAKRKGIHENNILQAFEALLRQQQTEKPFDESHTDKDNKLTITYPPTPVTKDSKAKGLITYVYTPATKDQQHSRKTSDINWTPEPVFDLVDLINRQQLSYGLNTIVVCYDLNEKQLFIFLRCISRNGEKYKHATHEQLVRKYKRFLGYLRTRKTTTSSARSLSNTTSIALSHLISTTPLEQCDDSSVTVNSSDLKLDLMKTNENLYGRITRIEDKSEFLARNDSCDEEQKVIIARSDNSDRPINETTITESNNNNIKKILRKPPEVPKRDPKTKLSPSSEQLPPIPRQRSSPTISQKSISNMTVPSSNLNKETKNGANPEESIYQPIWKCKTVGEVQERFKTDEDYYTIQELKAEQLAKLKEKPSSQLLGDMPEICVTEDDHSEWEADEEFVFTTQLKTAPSLVSVQTTESLSSQDRNGTIRSNRSHDSSIGSASLSGSTITDFTSSTATIASNVSSTLSASLVHHLFRNIGIFYSLTEPKLRAIIYDYDRIHSTKYFAKTNNAPSTVSNDGGINDSGLGKSPTPSAVSQNHQQHHRQQQHQHRSPVPVPRLQNGGNSPKCSSESVAGTTTTPRSPVAKATAVGTLAATTLTSVAALAATIEDSCPVASSSTDAAAEAFTAPNPSVLAWKRQLLNVNYMEDEEDMVSVSLFPPDLFVFEILNMFPFSFHHILMIIAVRRMADGRSVGRSFAFLQGKQIKYYGKF